MTQLKTILLALRALPALAARLILNLLPVLTARRNDNRRGFGFLPMIAVVCFAAFLTACGGGGGNSAAAPTFIQSAPLALINAPDIYASHVRDSDGSYYFVFERDRNPLTVRTTTITQPSGPLPGPGDPVIPPVTTIVTTTTPTPVIGLDGFASVTLQRMQVVPYDYPIHIMLPKLNPTLYFNNPNNLNEFVVENGRTVLLNAGEGQVFFEGALYITSLVQLCPASWVATYINANFPGTTCPAMSGLSYSPQMHRVIGAAMTDGFNRGVGIGESPFAFSGRYDGDNRAAGFTYDLGGYAFRTDYIRLPSRQDSEVWLDTYRFGALTRVNDEVQFFAGVDNYRNAIIAIDASGNNAHRLGFAIGDGYAVKYEYRLNL